jgi:protein DGCR14
MLTVRAHQVVDEDEFTSALEHIVERDYFPHVARLRAEAEYLDAQENNDVDKMREISMRYSRTPALADRTPRFDLTPRSVAPTPGVIAHCGTSSALLPIELGPKKC